ncbi:MAG: phage head closure protein [Pseudomonadota bacterium]
MGALGELRHRLTLEMRNVESDDAGGEIVTWIGGATVWGEVTPLSGVEFLRQDRLASTLTHRVRLRYRDDVSAAVRLRLGGRIFEILSVRDVEERHRWLECLCEEKYQ